jgi:ribose/xylose/arabinose/galactoside ABC-type transport system permease subunit
VELPRLPVPLLVTAAILGALQLLVPRTAWGHGLNAIGANPVAARLSGAPVARSRLFVCALMGLLVAAGAVLSVLRLDSGAPVSVPALTTLDAITLDAITAAAVIGGRALGGGAGLMPRTLVGALLIGVLNNGHAILDVHHGSQPIVKGILIAAVIAAVVLLDRWTRGRETPA